MPYAIERISDGERVKQYGSLPKSMDIGRQRIISPVAVGDEGLGYRFIEIQKVGFTSPGPYYNHSDSEDRVGNVVTITRTWTPWTQQEIDAAEAAKAEQTATQFDNVDDIVRAAVLALLQEMNTHAAALGLPERTPAQLRTAIKNKLGS